MSRTVIRYEQGKAIWSENAPANGSAYPAHLSGGLVQGEPGLVERQRRSEREFKARQR